MAEKPGRARELIQLIRTASNITADSREGSKVTLDMKDRQLLARGLQLLARRRMAIMRSQQEGSS